MGGWKKTQNPFIMSVTLTQKADVWKEKKIGLNKDIKSNLLGEGMGLLLKEIVMQSLQ